MIIQYFRRKFNKQKQICQRLRFLGENKTKVAIAKSYIYKTKYSKMTIIFNTFRSEACSNKLWLFLFSHKLLHKIS